MKLLKQFFFLFLILSQFDVVSQSYITNKSKYQFAQGAMGLDFQYLSRSGVSYVLKNGNKKEIAFGGYTIPRLVIGGLHFWGHADIAFNFPLGQIGKKEDSTATEYSDFDIMTFKYYPWAIKKNKIRPYFGSSININTYAQQGTGVYKSFFSGQDYRLNFPLQVGLSFQKGSWLINTDLKYNLNRERAIFASRTETVQMTLPSYSISLGIRKLFESTAPKFEKKYESGEMKKKYEENINKLNAFSFAIGFSTSIITGKNDYNAVDKKFMSSRAGAAFPDFGIGYYLNKPDIHFNLAFRNMNASEGGFGLLQEYKRQSITLEGYKFLFDYKGFVPFLGLGIGRENLDFKESDLVTKKSFNAQWSGFTPNLTFGWDIRYHRLYWLMLRTNMRYYPMLHIKSSTGKINFNQIELNFIQAVIYPQRFKYAKKK